MTSNQFVEMLQGILLEGIAELTDKSFAEFKRIETFEEAGVLTNSDGLVIRMTDGTTFQITVVRSR